MMACSDVRTSTKSLITSTVISIDIPPDRALPDGLGGEERRGEDNRESAKGGAYTVGIALALLSKAFHLVLLIN